MEEIVTLLQLQGEEFIIAFKTVEFLTSATLD